MLITGVPYVDPAFGFDHAGHEFVEVRFAAVGLDGPAHEGGGSGRILAGTDIARTEQYTGGREGKDNTHLSLQVE
jgi:hypothetical protein